MKMVHINDNVTIKLDGGIAMQEEKNFKCNTPKTKFDQEQFDKDILHALLRQLFKQGIINEDIYMKVKIEIDKS